ncbi:MAG: hypothetical protein V4519_03940 [Patescibacteria group bacterium]
MIKKINNYIQDRKITRRAKRDLNPSKEAMNHARLAFMGEVTERFPFAMKSTPKATHHYARFAIAGVVAILLINSGAVMYADTTNVDAEHPLYSFKLVAEKVQVLASSEEKRAELELKFAERRMVEIEVEEQYTEMPQEAREKKKIMLQAQLEKHMVNAERFIAMKQAKRGNVGIAATSTISVTATSTHSTSSTALATSTSGQAATSTLKSEIKTLIKEIKETSKEQKEDIKEKREAAKDALKASTSTSITAEVKTSECKKFEDVEKQINKLSTRKSLQINTKLDNIIKYCQD